MKTFLIALALLLASHGFGAETPAAKDTAGAVAALRTMDQQIESAMVRADGKFLESALAEDFRFNHIGAHRFQTKAQLIEEFGKPGSFVSRDVDEVAVEPHGEAPHMMGLTTGRIHFKTPDGNEQTLWYVRLYKQNAGRWQLVSHITTAKANGPLPAVTKK